MGTALFYHLTRSPVEATLPMLLQKSLQAGWRVAVRARARDRIEWLDERLWLTSDDGFLPHGLVGGPHDADQPVLLTCGTDLANGAVCLMAIDGAPVDAVEAARLERVCVLFDGNDPDAVALARDQWRALTGAKIPAQYWSEDSGRWEKRAEA